MPGLDRRGPEGRGSMSGRGLGRCNPNFNDTLNNEVKKVEDSNENTENLSQINRGYNVNSQMGLYPRGFARGMGRGCRRGFAGGFSRGRGFGSYGNRNRGNF